MRALAVALMVGALAATSGAAELTPAEAGLKRILGAETPDPVPLWPGRSPQFLENAPPATVDEHARLKLISVPTITPYLPKEGMGNGMAIVICPGGGYGGLDWRTHVVYAAQVFNPKGVAVIGLKYRTRPPHLVDNKGIQALTLLDAERAIRTVRHRASEWKLDPEKVGIAGYSAGGTWR